MFPTTCWTTQSEIAFFALTRYSRLSFHGRFKHSSVTSTESDKHGFHYEKTRVYPSHPCKAAHRLLLSSHTRKPLTPGPRCLLIPQDDDTPGFFVVLNLGTCCIGRCRHGSRRSKRRFIGTVGRAASFPPLQHRLFERSIEAAILEGTGNVCIYSFQKGRV